MSHTKNSHTIYKNDETLTYACNGVDIAGIEILRRLPPIRPSMSTANRCLVRLALRRVQEGLASWESVFSENYRAPVDPERLIETVSPKDLTEATGITDLKELLCR